MDNTIPLVSVIIPSYNCGKYIDCAVSSVLEQTYSNVEVIVVDDGSTDNTVDVLSKYGTKIKLISQTNQGVSKARNNGIQEAKGKYIATLDADDRWLEDRLEKMIPVLETGEIDILNSNFYLVNEQRIRISENNAFSSKYHAPSKEKQYEELLYTATALGLMIVKKDVITSIGGYDESLQGEAEDYDLWLRMLKNGAKWGYISEPLAEIMYRNGSLSKGYSHKRKQALKKIFYKHIDRIGKMKAYRLYRYHLGGYRFDMIIVSLRERNFRELPKFTFLMLKSPLFIPIIIKRVIKLVLFKSKGR